MPIQIRCTCQQILAVDEAHQGQVVGCPYCGTQLTVPVLQQHAQQPPPGYGAPPHPPGYPQQATPNYPQQFPGQPGWPNPSPPAPPSGPANNPFANVPAPLPANPFANLPAPQSTVGNSFGIPQVPVYPSPEAPAFPVTASSPASNAPSMPFLAMDVPAKGGPNLNDLTRGAPNVPGAWDESKPEEPRIWHIPCPKGHILDTPEDMLDQDVLCPYCETQFTLKKFQSVEETERRNKERAIRDERHGQLWLKWAIGIAAVVILGVIVMIAISASQ